MSHWRRMAAILSVLFLCAVLPSAFPALPSAAAAGDVLVKVSIAPCVRVRPDGVLESNIPAVTQVDGHLLLSVTPR
ncbi:MAG: hypothetical protein ACUVRX_06310 [Actinomycetota bacterium]